MGIANQQILSHLSIDDIPKSMLTNGGGSIHETHTENQIQQSNGTIDHSLSPSREISVAAGGVGGGEGGGEVNEKIGKPWHSILY